MVVDFRRQTPTKKPSFHVDMLHGWLPLLCAEQNSLSEDAAAFYKYLKLVQRLTSDLKLKPSAVKMTNVITPIDHTAYATTPVTSTPNDKMRCC